MNSVKFFLRYEDDLVRAVKGDPGVVLEAANKLHPNLQFTIEELDSNGNLSILFGLKCQRGFRKKGHMWLVPKTH